MLLDVLKRLFILSKNQILTFLYCNIQLLLFHQFILLSSLFFCLLFFGRLFVVTVSLVFSFNFCEEGSCFFCSFPDFLGWMLNLFWSVSFPLSCILHVLMSYFCFIQLKIFHCDFFFAQWVI